MNDLKPIGQNHILQKIDEAINSKDLVIIHCTKQRGMEGWILGYHEENDLLFCEILVNNKKCTEQVELKFEQYTLILPSEIEIITLTSQNKFVYHPIRYKERIKLNW